MTSYKSIKTDVTNAGAKWQDSEVVVDQGVVTSLNPATLKPSVPRSSKKAGTSSVVPPSP
jgi:putative intracellular protease/amidase